VSAPNGLPDASPRNAMGGTSVSTTMSLSCSGRASPRPKPTWPMSIRPSFACRVVGSANCAGSSCGLRFRQSQSSALSKARPAVPQPNHGLSTTVHA
jgi:hypothetical protein